MGAGMLAPLQDVGVVDEHHIAGRPADHLQTVPGRGGKGQAPAEHTAGPQLLQHSGHALLVDADQGGLSALHHAHGIAAGTGEIIDHIVGAVAPLHRLKTVQHPLIVLIPDVLKQRTLCQFLPGQHDSLSFLLHISHFLSYQSPAQM